MSRFLAKNGWRKTRTIAHFQQLQDDGEREFLGVVKVELWTDGEQWTWAYEAGDDEDHGQFHDKESEAWKQGLDEAATLQGMID